MANSGHLSFVTRRDESGRPLPPQGRRKVFISYRKRDNLSTGVRDIVIDKILGIVDCAVWYDDGGLTPGLDYRQEIIDAITECDAMVLLLTKDIMQSEFVWEVEVPAAVGQQKGIIPIALDISAGDYAEVEKRLGKSNIQILRWSSGSEGVHGMVGGADFDDALRRALDTFVVNADLQLRVAQFFASGAHNTSISHLTPEHRYLMGVGYIRGIGTKKDTDEGTGLLDSVTLIPCDKEDSETNSLKASAAAVLIYALPPAAKAAFLTDERIDRFADIGEAVGDDSLLYRLANYTHRELGSKCKAVTLYTKAANLGSDSAMFNLGLMYSKGEGVAQSTTAAIEWYEKGVALGNSGSMNNLGAICCDAVGTERNYPRALELYSKAVELGNATAMCNLAGMYVRGTAGVQDIAKAFELYTNAAMLGEMMAREELGDMYRTGSGTPRDPAKALRLYERAADQGSTSAMLSLSQMLLKGEGVPQDVSKATEWLMLAAAKGDLSALLTLGDLYTNKEHLPRDRKKAREYYRRVLKICREGAKKGDAAHLYTLGHIYSGGQGVAKNRRRAFRYFRRAAQAGSLSALHRVALAYYNGQGVRRNRARALETAQKGDAAGILDCAYLLGIMYLYGKGVRKDHRKALGYLEKCANYGSADTMHWMGAIYARGKHGAQQDAAAAYRCFAQAAELGHKQAAKMKRIYDRFGLLED